jgi:excisionase family DNA binding protein
MRQEKAHIGVQNLPSATNELLTRGQVCRLCQISTQTVIRLEQSGALPSLRLGAGSVRIRRSDLEKFLANCTAPKADRETEA